ncbi:MAG: hypothetical protein ACLUOF_06270 [Ruminococcus sp.]
MRWQSDCPRRLAAMSTPERPPSACVPGGRRKRQALLEYAEPNPYAYSYNDACTAFARGESAMYPIGSYAVPQIQSVNPT